MTNPTPPPPIVADAATSATAIPDGHVQSSTPLGRSKMRRPRNRIIVISIGGAVILACLGGIVAVFGRVSGREFAPSAFETRYFSFVEIPILRLQITPIRRTNHYSALAAYLNTAALIPRVQGTPTQWHLIELRRAAVSTLPADAKLLSDFLEQPTVSGAGTAYLHWHQWSLDHPEMAAVLWPAIQKLAQRELYLLIPDVFRLAEQSGSAEAFAEELQLFIASSYEELIVDLRAADQTGLAESFLAEAIADYPDDPRWQQFQ
jgi:hypothetical protein